ncbi:hypothetical protein [Paenibacillus thiaminolyticus]|uniref:hypothetical protein n=1 Tax=Paenibacillus thiaminolyticus TaxID=49283 RepID=UPI0025439EAF|nr:hypothetical protein [Paenibacillus thiaminolyticus]WII36497.1 hypothetical protein O0V01_22975 [Paenibacillus thiaminolyticus]
MMRALFHTYHYVDLHFNNIEDETGHRGDCQFIELPPMSSQDRLTRYRDIIQAWEPLLAAGYLPFSEAEDSQGPVCFDMTRIDDSGDYPVVWFLHDHLHDWVRNKAGFGNGCSLGRGNCSVPSGR